MTSKRASFAIPKVVDIATSAASRARPSQLRVLGEERDVVAVDEPHFIFALIAPQGAEMNQFPFLISHSVYIERSDRRSAIGLKVSSHCSALDSSIASYVRIRTEFRLATRNKVHAAQFFLRARHLPH